MGAQILFGACCLVAGAAIGMALTVISARRAG